MLLGCCAGGAERGTLVEHTGSKSGAVAQLGEATPPPPLPPPPPCPDGSDGATRARAGGAAPDATGPAPSGLPGTAGATDEAPSPAGWPLRDEGAGPGSSSALLDEDRALMELESGLRGAARAALPSLRQRAAGLTAGLPAQARDDAAWFCSDETLVRYLATCDNDVERAATMLGGTLEWRAAYFEGTDLAPARRADGAQPRRSLCLCCASDPRQHCAFRIGTDVAGRHVIYSCAGRSCNKSGDVGVRHVFLELERLFQAGSGSGQVVWIMDFAGFGLADCNPRTCVVLFSLVAAHYPDRLGQILLLGVPSLAVELVNMVKRLHKDVARRTVILKGAVAQKRYMDAYWSCDPAMLAWMRATLRCKGTPGSYPDLELSRALKDECTVEMLERCAALQEAS